MNKLKLFQAMALLMTFSDEGNSKFNNRTSTIKIHHKAQVIPKGHTEYFFDKNGQRTVFQNETVFSCTALNITNANRKFKKYISENEPQDI